MEQAGHRNDGTDEEYEESFWCLSEFVPLVINDMYGVQEGEVVFWHWGLKGRGCKFHLFTLFLSSVCVSGAHKHVKTSFWAPRCLVGKQIRFTFLFYSHNRY